MRRSVTKRFKNHEVRLSVVQVFSRRFSNAALKNVALYGVSTLLVSGSNFLTVPLLLALVGREGFSIWSLLEPLILIFLPVAGLGINFGLINAGRKSHSDTRLAAEALILSHALLAAIVGSGVGFCAFLLGTPVKTSALLSGVIALEGTIVFFVALFRAQDRPLHFAGIEGGRTFLTFLIVGGATLVGTIHFDISSYLAVRAVTAMVALVIAVITTKIKFRPSVTITVDAIRYGLPLVAGSLVVAALSSVDRYILSVSGGLMYVAEYTAHAKLAQTVSLATGPFFMWFAPKAIQRMPAGPESNPYFIACTSYVFIFALMACGSLQILAPALWPILFPPLEFDFILFSSMIVGVCALAMAPTLGIGCLEPGRTHRALILTLISFVVSIIASALGGYTMGVLGVSLGRSVGFLTYMILYCLSSLVGLRINYPLARYAVLYVLSLFFAIFISDLSVNLGIVNSLLIAISYSILVGIFGMLLLRKNTTLDNK